MEEPYYRTFSSALKELFGAPVYKITLDAGMTCPNRDGRVGRGGCSYCNPEGSGPGRAKSLLSIRQQLEEGKVYYDRRPGEKKFIAYFQAFSGTYTTPDHLKKLLDEALSVEGIVGLDLATRSDCLSDEMLDMLMPFREKTYFWLEIGLQTANDDVLKKINRGHDVASFVEAVQRAKKRGFQICAHVIFGLPGDDELHRLKGAELISSLRIDGLKLHHLHILKGSPMESLWEKGAIPTVGLEEYARWVVDFLERIPSSVIIQRLVGSAPSDQLLAPAWTLQKAKAIRAIEEEFSRRQTRQGKIFENRRSSSPDPH